MKQHSAIGADMAAGVLSEVDDEEIRRISENIAHAHHEKWNGAGYPDRLSGEDIPLEARIMAVADVYDALVSRRSYKEPMSFEQAYSIMEESFGSHFDPSLRKYFEQCRSDIEAFYAEQRAAEDSRQS